MERIVVNPNAAYDKFKDKHVSTKGLGQFALDSKSIIKLVLPLHDEVLMARLDTVTIGVNED